jgi:hypothetical protein
MAWETGNELYFPPAMCTIDIGKYIKDLLEAKQLFMDGRHVSATGFNAELNDPIIKDLYTNTVDIVSDHAYPMYINILIETARVTIDELHLPFTLGEIGWASKVDLLDKYLEEIEMLRSIGYISSSLFWSLFGHAETYGHVSHDDAYSVYFPSGPPVTAFHDNTTEYRLTIKSISDHMYRMKNSSIPYQYQMADIAPVVTLLLCNEADGIQLGFRGVAGAYMYNVRIDENIAITIEDIYPNQKPFYIRWDSVHPSSMVTITPLSYTRDGKTGSEGMSSGPQRCP